MKTTTMLLIGGAAIAGGYLIFKATSPSQPTTAQTLMGGLTNIVGKIADAVKGSKSAPAGDASAQAVNPFTGGMMSSTPSIARQLPDYNAGGAGQLATAAWSSYGDAAQSDGGGFSRLSGRTQQPYTYMTRAQNAQFGNINYGANHFALKS